MRKIRSEAEKYLARRRRKHRWAQTVRILSCAVVLFTVYALILPGITMEKTDDELLFEETYEAEERSDLLIQDRSSVSEINSSQKDSANSGVSLEEVEGLIEDMDELEEDPASEPSPETIPVLVCSEWENPQHVHTANCYVQVEKTAENLKKICQETDPEHVHTAECYILEEQETQETEVEEKITEEIQTETVQKENETESETETIEEPAAEPEKETETETIEEPAAEPEKETETETIEEPAAELEKETETAPETEIAAKTETESQIETETAEETESETKAEPTEESETETVTEPENESELASECETETRTEQESKTEAESELASECESETRTELESKTEAESELASEAETLTETEIRNKTEMESELEPETETESELESETESETETETESEQESETESELETENETEPETLTFSAVSDAFTVQAVCEAGILPEDTVLYIREADQNEASAEEAVDLVSEVLLQQNRSTAETAVYEITFLNEAGEQIAPAGKVSVDVTLNQPMETEEAIDCWSLFYIKDEEKTETVSETESSVGERAEKLTDSGKAEIMQKEQKAVTGFRMETDRFGLFVLAGETIDKEVLLDDTKELIWEGSDYSITVKYDAEAALPEDVTLEVTEIEKDSEEYQSYLEQAIEAAESGEAENAEQKVTFARFFDVQFVKDGEKLEPEAPVLVTITYEEPVDLGPEGNCQAVHFAQEGIEVLEVTAKQQEDGTVSFTHSQDSFSVVGNVVTYQAETSVETTGTGGSRRVRFLVKTGDEFVEVGSADSYETGSVNGTVRAYITSETAEKYFKQYGYTKNADPAGSFQYSYDDIYTLYYARDKAKTGYCMDVSGNSIAEGTNILLYSSNGTEAQVFRIHEPEAGYCYLSPLADTSYHVSVQEKTAANGAKLILSQETGSASRWKMQSDENGIYFASKLNEGYSIDLNGNTLPGTNGVQLQIWGDSGAKHWKLEQQYRYSASDVEKNTDGTYKIGLTSESNGDIVCVYVLDESKICTQEGLKKLENGGSYQLVDDILITSLSGDAAAVLTGSVSSTLDLNGYTITHNPDTSDSTQSFKSLFWVCGNSSLTIKDSGQAVDNSQRIESGSGNLTSGKLADYDNSSETLTYYVTESAVNADGVTTTETLVLHTVDLSRVGAIESTTAPNQLIAVVDNATLTIEGGRYTNPNGKRAITVHKRTDSSENSADLYIKGGYICGNTAYGNKIVGGGISSESSGVLEISGGVIAANRADKAGGVYQSGGTFKMTGGVISGNQVPADCNKPSSSGGHDSRGGGVQTDTDCVISGGYITNNRADYYCENVGAGCHFGGGLTCYNGTLTMNGGYITGNYSEESGGGIGFDAKKFVMTGGTVAANVANKGEGGGIRIQNCSGTDMPLISGGYITNNRTNTNHDWGGGGIFVTQGNSLQIQNGIFTQNHANGFGGGVGGCSTGQIVAVDNAYAGVAIYANTASGTTMAGSDGVPSPKQDDLTARSNEVFMTSGYQDFFCALNSVVTGTMLGGGSQEWKGSCDYEAVAFSKEEVKVASQMMGLTAYPSDEDIATAVKNKNVVVSGNFSGTHGGGVMSNGLLVLGEATAVEQTPGLKIEVPKRLQDENGTALGLAEGQFTFLLLGDNGEDKVTENTDGKTVSYKDSNILKRAVNKADGTVLLEPEIPKQEGTYTWYLLEKPGDESAIGSDITYDSSVYKLKVTIGKQVIKRQMGPGKTLTLTSYVVTGVNVSLLGGGDLDVTTSYINSTDANHRAEVTIKKSGTTAAFINIIKEKPLYFQIHKVDGSNNNAAMQFVTFTLQEISDGASAGAELSKKTDYYGNVEFQIQKGRTYQLLETCPAGYYQAGPWILEVSDSGDTITVYSAKTKKDGTYEKDSQGNFVKDEVLDTLNAVDKTNSVYYAYTITNIQGYVLPSTGGSGTLPFTAGGIALTGIALLGYVALCRQNRKVRKTGAK